MTFEAKLLTQILSMLCVGLVGFAGFLLLVSPIQHGNDQDRLYADFREQVAKATAPTGGAIDPGSPVALLEVPGLALKEVVVEGTSSSDLLRAPGHRRDTPLPGQPGISTVYGKSATFGGPFAQIDRLTAGDRITVTTGQGTFTYRVIGIRHPGDPVPAALAANAGRLVLETSTGSNLLQHENTVLVDADLLDKAVPGSGDTPEIIPPEEKAMASDRTTMIGLVLWLQVLGVLLGGIVWARRRWGKREAVLVGAPLCLAVVWNLYETVAGLLPNLL